MTALAQFEQRLGYRFTDGELLERALSHRSLGRYNNERLEFLGDAVLNLVIAEALYTRCPQAAEGDLSRLRATLVRGETLAQIALELELPALLRLGDSARKSGGRQRRSILADAFEALLGAIYLERGHAAAAEVILRLFGPRLADLPPAHALKDPKTRLQEWLQQRGRALPAYRVVAATGADHARHFVVECEVALSAPVQGEGASRRKAEQAAAARALAALEAAS
ncbi:MAG: ribonuclease III [Pseudomonadota bacterium]|nr:ribonuclease III [Pseudomonadota bacterium]